MQVKNVFKTLQIICLEHSIVMYVKEDRALPDYAWWFYFSQVYGILVFKYRPVPHKKYIPDTIYINDKNQTNDISALIVRTIKARYSSPVKDINIAPKEKTLKQSRSSHESVFVPPTYENELYDKKRVDMIIKFKTRKK